MRAMILTSLLALAGNSALAASDYHILPGITCQPLDDAAAVMLDRDLGAIHNTDTDTQTVTCPIVRDNPTTLTKLSVKVYVYDQNDGEDVECTLKSKYMSSMSTYASSSNASSSYSGTPSSFTLGSISVPASTSSPAMVYFNCTIPPVFAGNQSAIIGYLVTES